MSKCLCDIHFLAGKIFCPHIFFVYACAQLRRIFGQKKKLSAQEMERRKDEETLFSGIAAPPTLLSNINEVLQNDDDLKEEELGSS